VGTFRGDTQCGPGRAGQGLGVLRDEVLQIVLGRCPEAAGAGRVRAVGTGARCPDRKAATLPVLSRSIVPYAAASCAWSNISVSASSAGLSRS
jgi:hypothetical protein